ncbi:hypothetical protein HK097_001930 [Rhizophlyctis rosea]|uniref:RidA family protein n=1 Tax=Rhizophlyctis rosea TaxID=64517 RepID=A0AAD5SLE3_9FUNG|nr:hypothetical protein HK097_001930 [Rhizophlyctis rosea]
MSTRQDLSTGSKWEPIIGYCRAVKIGNSIFVSGTTGTDPATGQVAKGDVYAQAKQALANITAALAKLGATHNDIVRTRIYLVDVKRDWEQASKAHGELFTTSRPATSLVGVAALIDDDMLVEIEADVVLSA